MGGGTYDPSAFRSYTSTARGQTQQQNFKSRSLNPSMDPLGIKTRESRDSTEHPESNAVAVCFDVTGSMGSLANYMATGGLPKMVEEILSEDRNALPHPQVLFMAQGDGYRDLVPFQIAQFESDIRMTDWLSKIYLDGGGGGNGGESYWMAYYAAAYKTSIDCWEKRQRKGFLFTIGDEPPHMSIEPAHVKAVFGDTIEGGITFKDLIEVTRRTWNCFHIIVGADDCGDVNTITSWKKVLGENALVLDDHTKIAELIVSTIEVVNGKDLSKVASSWSGSTSVSVSNALSGTARALQPRNKGGLARL